MKFCVDMSAMIWRSLLWGKDVDSYPVMHNEKEVWINTATYGFENALKEIVEGMEQMGCVPRDLVLVYPGRDAKKRRLMIENTYKAGRDDGRPPEYYEEFNKVQVLLWDALGKVGAIRVHQDFVEEDDVLGWLAENSEEDMVIQTSDGDLSVLQGVNAYGARIHTLIGGQLNINKYGNFDIKLVTLYKSLVGDSSDKIKGCPGFGPKAWEELHARYKDEGCTELLGLIASNNRDTLSGLAAGNKCKLLGKIVEEWDQVQRSYKLAKIHVEWVNTVMHQPVWQGGMVVPTDEFLVKKYRGQTVLVTADNYDMMLKHLKSKIGETEEPAFDIETSTPEESDDWLEAQGSPDGVDVMGSHLVGFSITYGRNQQYTVYVSVKHTDTKNISMRQAREMIEVLFEKDIVIQNTNFELVVLYNDMARDEDGTLWRDAWKKYGNHGMIPKILDTKMEASYVNENVKTGLKDRSRMHLGYPQESFEKTMTIVFDPAGIYEQDPEKAGKETVLRCAAWPKGRTLETGSAFPEAEIGSGQFWTRKRFKMDQVPATHVLKYGADDTICTSALHNLYKLLMELDHHYHVYKEVELNAAFLHAKNFYDGFPVSLARIRDLDEKDQKTFDDNWAILREYLIAKGWEGTVPPVFTPDLTVKDMKLAYSIVNGVQEESEDEDDDGEEKIAAPKDAILSSRVRTPAKFPALMREAGQDLLATLIEKALAGDASTLQEHVMRHFKGDPVWKISNKNMTHLMYTVMGLPIRIRNAPTAKMKKEGKKEGNPKGDKDAVEYALIECKEEDAKVLKAIRLMQMVQTRQGLYYKTYPYFVHWKTGKIHSNHNQCGTNTRRASSSKPNMQQMPKHAKIEGEKPEFRSVVLPHKPGAVIVSMDFEAQELRVIADYSQDEQLLACYIGEHLKDVHILTGAAIAAKKDKINQWTYELLEKANKDKSHSLHALAKEFRAKGKTVNFATEYGAQALKIALTMKVSEEDAQTFINAREATFPGIVKWKETVVDEALRKGQVRTKLGAVRHLQEALNSKDRSTESKAERQSINFKVQSSCAEMTKLAEGRMWESGMFTEFDAVCIGPVHDEVLASIMIEDLPVLIPIMHKAMVAQYADMVVPIGSSISFGPNFLDQIEIGNAPTLEAIKQGLVAAAKEGWINERETVGA